MANMNKRPVKNNKGEAKAQVKKTERKFIITPDAMGPFYEYNMSKSQAYDITHGTDGKPIKEAKGRELEYLVEYINDQYGLMGTCIRVNIA